MYYSSDELRNLLYKVELEHKLSVIYGLESGSRAWEFESQNRDYDVRFSIFDQLIGIYALRNAILLII